MAQSPVQGPVGLTPVPPHIKAKHKRQNRLIIALFILIILPVTFYVGSNRLAEHTVEDWAAHPTLNLGNPTFITIDEPGDYIVWTVPTWTDCTVSFNALPVAGSTDGQTTVSAAGFYPSFSFTATQAGDYLVSCDDPAPSLGGYAMVSTPLPEATVGLIVLGGLGLAVLSGGIGLGLLIRALVENSNEKKRALLAAHPPAPYHQPGPPPVRYAAPPPHPLPPMYAARPPGAGVPSAPAQTPANRPGMPGVQPTRPTTPPWPPAQ